VKKETNGNPIKPPLGLSQYTIFSGFLQNWIFVAHMEVKVVDLANKCLFKASPF
jgi:hypothetical protein